MSVAPIEVIILMPTTQGLQLQSVCLGVLGESYRIRAPAWADCTRPGIMYTIAEAASLYRENISFYGAINQALRRNNNTLLFIVLSRPAHSEYLMLQ